LLRRREGLASAIKTGIYNTSVRPVESAAEGVRLLRFTTKGAARAVVIHFHGGAYRLGSAEMSGPFAAALSARCNVEVICPDYRLAPEHPMPAALHDGIKAVNAALDLGYSRLILSGDSAGGGLAASITPLCVGAGVPLAALVLISPWLDLTLKNECYRENAAADTLFSYQQAAEAADLYLQGAAAEDPLASALFANVMGFPPTLISAGAEEVLAGDAERFQSKLELAGVRCRLLMTDGMQHVAVVRGLDLPGAAGTFDRVAQFIDESLDTSSVSHS
jgi:acetyl esterase/lipase